MGSTLAYKITVNGFDVTGSIEPYLLSIKIEDTFDTDFTVSKLEFRISKYIRSANWKYKDQLKLEMWYTSAPTNKYITGIFYIDYVEDDKTDSQSLIVSAQEADPALGFDAGVGITYITQKNTDAVNAIVSIFGLTTANNLVSNIYLGTYDNPSLSTTPPTSITITYNSYIDALKNICKNFGYFGNISGTRLVMYRINSSAHDNNTFIAPVMQSVYSVNFRQMFTNIAKSYKINYVNRSVVPNTWSTATASGEIADLNNFSKTIDRNKYYYDMSSANERIGGEYFMDLYNSFEINISCKGDVKYLSGAVFLLDASYGTHVGYYRCTKVSNVISNGVWISNIKGCPLKIYSVTTSTYNTGIYPSRNTKTTPITITTTLRGVAPITFTAAQFDNFVTSMFPNYAYFVGGTVLMECSKAANNIRPDILFAIMLWQNNLFRDASLGIKNNPAKLGTAASATTPETYTNITTGIRAAVQILFAFSTTTGTPSDAIVATRYNLITRGSATTVAALNNLWDSSDTNFSYMILSYLTELYLFVNKNYAITFS